MSASVTRIRTASSRVLVVDDDEDTRSVLSDALEAAGYQVETASDGFEALALLARAMATPSLMLIDLHMPNMDGWTLCAKVRDERPDSAMAVVAISADLMNAAEIEELGVDAYVRKPLGLADLLALTARFCPLARARVNEEGPPAERRHPRS